MREKDEILHKVRHDITYGREKQHPGLWVQYTLIEVLIDIRDVLNELLEKGSHANDHP